MAAMTSQPPSAGAPDPTPTPSKRPARWTPLRVFGLVVVVFLLGLVGYGVVKLFTADVAVDRAQAALDPFYTPPSQVPATPGTVIRSEPMNLDLANGTATRVLYTSRDLQGTPIAVSGMVFTPTTPASPTPIVAWAHPTLGQADKCAPSRSAKPLSDMDGWLEQMLARGWVVTATDYAGLGTPGPKTYLVGEQSANDVVNSVRAAQEITATQTSTDWLLWSHSQGGQAALWTAAESPTLAPELNLRGVGVAAPAAELMPIMDAQWDTTVAWVIGPEATESFVPTYPELDVLSALSQSARDAMADLAKQCITGQGIRGELREAFDEQFFAANPTTNAAWKQIVTEQTPPVLPPDVPILLVQGTADEVVLASTNALFQNKWCAQGANLSALWLGGVNHAKAATTGGPSMVEWAVARFAGETQIPNCSFPPPVVPAADISATS